MVKSSYLAAAAWVGAVACAGVAIPAVYAQSGSFVPVTKTTLADPDPADWLHISRTYDQHRFSPLKQINKSNVAQLRMAWSRGLPAGTQESTPLVYRGVMYVMAPGATIQALNATNGDLIWEYRRGYAAGVVDGGRAQQEPRHLRGHDLFRRARRVPAGARCADRQAAVGNQSGRRPDHGGRAARRRRQGDFEPHLPAGQARVLLHRRPRCEDRQGSLEVLRDGGIRRAGRRHVGQRSSRSARRRSVGTARFVRSRAPGRLLGRREPEPVYAVQAVRPLRYVRADVAQRAVQQLDDRARRRDRQAGLVFPGAARRRLGRRPQPGTPPHSHARPPRPAIRQVDQPGDHRLAPSRTS